MICFELFVQSQYCQYYRFEQELFHSGLVKTRFFTAFTLPFLRGLPLRQFEDTVHKDGYASEILAFRHGCVLMDRRARFFLAAISCKVPLL